VCNGTPYILLNFTDVLEKCLPHHLSKKTRDLWSWWRSKFFQLHPTARCHTQGNAIALQIINSFSFLQNISIKLAIENFRILISRYNFVITLLSQLILISYFMCNKWRKPTDQSVAVLGIQNGILKNICEIHHCCANLQDEILFKEEFLKTGIKFIDNL
jgi:hypothetical protein